MTGPAATEALELRQYLHALRQRWKVVAVVAVILTGLGAAHTSRLEPQYVSSAEVLLEGTDAERIFDPNAAPSGEQASTQIDTEIEVLRSRALRDAVKEQLGRVPNIRIERRGDSAVLAIIATARDRRLAEAAAQAYADTYVTTRKRQLVESIEIAIAQLETQLGTVTTRLAELDLPLIDLENRIISEEILATRALLEDQRDTLMLQQQGERLSLRSRNQTYAVHLDGLRLTLDVTETGGAQVVSDATVPRHPISPRPVRNLAASVLVGLILGISLAFVIDHHDDRIRGRAELDQVAPGLPVLGSIPAMVRRRGRRRMRPGLAGADSSSSEAYGSLGSAVQFACLERSIKILQFTSPSMGEGKTTTAANVAVSLARAGKRVIAVDYDLRRPRLASVLGLDNEVGFTSVLDGSVTLADALHGAPGEPLLAVLPSGPVPSNPSELLSMRRTAAILTALAAESAFVLVDGPPLTAVSDSIVVAGVVDAVVLVVRAGSTTKRDLATAMRLLEQVDAPVIGWVLNRCDEDAGGYGSRYRSIDGRGGAQPRSATREVRSGRLGWLRSGLARGRRPDAAAPDDATLERSLK